MDEYLPPVVTRLKGDWSDLRNALLESRVAVKAWAAGVRDDVVNGLRKSGHDGGLAFADALKATAGKSLLDGFDEDVGRKLANQGRKAGQKAGESAGMGLIETFKGMFMPGMIAIIVALTPMIGTAIAAAITLGLGLGFIGIAALVQKSNPALVKAATGFKDTVLAAFKDATSPMVGPMITALGILGAGIKALAPGFKEIFAAISRSVPNLAMGLVEMIQAMMPGLKELAPVAGSLISALAVALPLIGSGLGGLFSELAKAAPDMVVFIEDFGAVLGDVLPMVGTLLLGLSQVYSFIEHGKGQGLGLLGGPEMMVKAWPKVVEGAKAAWEWIKKVASAVADWVTGTAGKVADWWNGLVEGVQSKGKKVQDWFEALPGRIGDWLAALPGKLRDAMFRAFDAFFFTLGFMVVRAGQFIGMIITFFHTLPQRIGMAIVELWESVKRKTVEGADNTHNTIKQWAEKLPVILDKLWHDFLDWGKRTWESVTNWVFKTISDVLRFWDELPGRIRKTNDKIVETLKEWGRKAGDWLLQTGKDLIQGLINGITSAAGAVTTAVKRAIEKAIEGAKKALGISSPSRVFAEMGKFSMLGYVQGLQSEQGMLARAWTGLAPNSPVVGQAAASPAAASAAASGGGDDKPILVQLLLDGSVLVERLIPAAQQRKLRTGTTGLT